MEKVVICTSEDVNRDKDDDVGDHRAPDRELVILQDENPKRSWGGELRLYLYLNSKKGSTQLQSWSHQEISQCPSRMA